MLLETVSLNYQLALLQGNSTAQAFGAPLPTLWEPGSQTDGQDGYWPASWFQTQGVGIHRQVRVLPFALVGPVSMFSLRVYGWTRATANAPPNITTLGPGLQPIWVPILLAELLCQTADIPGPSTLPDSVTPYPVVPATSNFCDTITLTQGDLGFYGRINSVGAGGTGQNLIAYALVDIQGSQKISFDFQWNDIPAGASMNALWCYCG